MYAIIRTDHNEKMIFLCFINRNNAIAYLNFLEQHREWERGLFSIEKIPSPIDIDNPDQWTKHDYKDEPDQLYLPNIFEHLLPNNPLYTELKNAEDKKQNDLIKKEKKLKEYLEKIDDMKIYLKDQFYDDLVNKYHTLKQLKDDVDMIHKQMIEERKKLKKQLISQNDFDALENHYKQTIKERGRASHKFTSIQKKMINEGKSWLSKNNVHVILEERFSFVEYTHVFDIVVGYSMPKIKCFDLPEEDTHM